jgi:hypothetical protein
MGMFSGPSNNKSSTGISATNAGEKVMNMEEILQIVCNTELGKVKDQLMQ